MTQACARGLRAGRAGNLCGFFLSNFSLLVPRAAQLVLFSLLLVGVSFIFFCCVLVVRAAACAASREASPLRSREFPTVDQSTAYSTVYQLYCSTSLHTTFGIEFDLTDTVRHATAASR